MADRGDDELARADEAGVVRLPRDEIRDLERQEADAERLIDPLVPLAQSVTNRAVGVADELGRLILAFLGVLVVLIVLAVVITPWIWIAVVVWIGLGTWTIVRLSGRSRRGPRPPSIER